MSADTKIPTVLSKKTESQTAFEPQLSVIVTASNSKARIVETVTSILSQNDPLGTEVILISAKKDSGEIGHLEQELHSKISEEKLRIFGIPDDSLWVNLKNAGAEKARGKRLSFVTAGDLFLPNRLKTLTENLGGTSFLGSPDLPILKPENLFQALLNSQFSWMDSSVVIDQTLFWEVGGYPVGPLSSPESLWLKALALLKKRNEEDRVCYLIDPQIEEHEPLKHALALPNVIKTTTHRIQQVQARISAMRYASFREWPTVAKSLKKMK